VDQKVVREKKLARRRAIMILDQNQSIAAITGGVQQKNPGANYGGRVFETASGQRMSRTSGRSSGLMLVQPDTGDAASISRPGIVALESTQSASDENVIRDGDQAGQALVYSTSQIADDPQAAVDTQANQTVQQVLGLITAQ
jgi:hypothetical protein